jgi:hypothetical protein
LLICTADEDVEEKSAPAGSSRGYFSHLAYYLKLYETLHGAFEV